MRFNFIWFSFLILFLIFVMFVLTHFDSHIDIQQQIPSQNKIDGNAKMVPSFVFNNNITMVLFVFGYMIDDITHDCVRHVNEKVQLARQAGRLTQFYLFCNTEDAKYDAEQLKARYSCLEVIYMSLPELQPGTKWQVLNKVMKDQHLGSVIYLESKQRLYVDLPILYDACQRYCQQRIGLLKHSRFRFIGSQQALEKCLSYINSWDSFFWLPPSTDELREWWRMLPTLPEEVSQFQIGIFSNDNNWHAADHGYQLISHIRNPDDTWQIEPLKTSEPRSIDVLLLVHPKDVATLQQCINGIKANLLELRKIFIITAVPADTLRQSIGIDQTDDDIVILDENDRKSTGMPFIKTDVQARIGNIPNRAGWYMQQLFKLYADCIPGALPWILSIDSDTIMVQRVRFRSLGGLTLFSDICRHPEQVYMQHIQSVLPSVFNEFEIRSGIVHHMLLHAPKLQDLRRRIEVSHLGQGQCWEILLDHVKPEDYKGSGMSEFELYFHFFRRFYPQECDVRTLIHHEVNTKEDFEQRLNSRSCHLLSAHEWARNFDRFHDF